MHPNNSNKPFELNVIDAVDRLGDTVVRVARRCLPNAHDVDDVFQTVFMRLLKANVKFKNEEHVKEWVIQTTIRICSEEIRNHEPTASIYEADHISIENSPELQNASLEEAIDKLIPPIRRAIVLLFYYEGYSTKEISKIIGMKDSTVRSHLKRARETLRIAMEGVGNE